jgi:hypothetical protein
MQELVPIVIPAMVFATPVLIMLIVFWFQWKRDQSKKQLIEKALELGKDIDPTWLAAPFRERKQRPCRLLTTGVILVSLGLAVFGSLMLLTDLDWASLSSLLLFPGIGLVVLHILKRKYKTEQ